MLLATSELPFFFFLLLCWYKAMKYNTFYLKQGETIDDIPQAVIDDCVQLVKANSIQGRPTQLMHTYYTLYVCEKMIVD